LSGGEPFLALDLLELGLIQATRLGLSPWVTTNAFWAKTPAIAYDTLAHLADLGLNDLGLSYDRFHAAFIPRSCLRNAYEQATKLGYQVRQNIVMTNEDTKGMTLDSAITQMEAIMMKPFTPGSKRRGWTDIAIGGPAARVGRGANLSSQELRLTDPVALECPGFKDHHLVLMVFPNHLVSVCCPFANPRLTYRYPHKENWIADMLQVWNRDRCITDMWGSSLTEIMPPPHGVNHEHPCSYCFKRLPALYPDKELIDIRALQ